MQPKTPKHIKHKQTFTKQQQTDSGQQQPSNTSDRHVQKWQNIHNLYISLKKEIQVGIKLKTSHSPKVQHVEVCTVLNDVKSPDRCNM